MAQRSYSPYPSVDSASDYSPEPLMSSPPKRRARGTMTAEERREARAHRNRLAAQSSRDRKKAQFEGLRSQVHRLEEENRALRLKSPSTLSSSSSSSVLDAALAKENADLRSRVQQLEQAWQNMVKILGTMAIPVPSTVNVNADATQSTPHPSLSFQSPVLSLPLSPAPTSSSESVDVMSESTRELAAGGSFSALFGPQTPLGAEQLGTTPVYDITNASPVTNDQWTASALLLTNTNINHHDTNSSSTTAALNHGYSEMDRLLDLLPSSVPEQSLDLGLGPLVSSNPDDWSWLNENAF